MRPLSVLLIGLVFVGGILPERDMREMAKLPALIGHFIEHVGQGEGVMEFLAEHYGAHDHDANAAGESDHDSLPFRTHQQDDQSCPSSVIEPTQPPALVAEHGLIVAGVGLPEDPLLPIDQGVSIWRPPRRA